MNHFVLYTPEKMWMIRSYEEQKAKITDNRSNKAKMFRYAAGLKNWHPGVGCVGVYTSAHYEGHSCKIGNMCLLGTSGIQNRQFHAICYFCLLFTLKQYVESRKQDGQPYCTFNQTSVTHKWKFHVPRRHNENHAVCLAR